VAWADDAEATLIYVLQKIASGKRFAALVGIGPGGGNN
jgi:hypothetical protein